MPDTAALTANERSAHAALNPARAAEDRATRPISPDVLDATAPRHDADLRIIRLGLAALVKADGRDLSIRQLSILLRLALEPGQHTVRGTAAALHINKPAVTRAMDRLAEAGLARRAVDQRDRRSVNLSLTPQGFRYVVLLGSLGAEAA